MHKQAGQPDRAEQQPGPRSAQAQRPQQPPAEQRRAEQQQAVGLGLLPVPDREGRAGHQQASDKGGERERRRRGEEEHFMNHESPALPLSRSPALPVTKKLNACRVGYRRRRRPSQRRGQPQSQLTIAKQCDPQLEQQVIERRSRRRAEQVGKQRTPAHTGELPGAALIEPQALRLNMIES